MGFGNISRGLRNGVGRRVDFCGAIPDFYGDEAILDAHRWGSSLWMSGTGAGKKFGIMEKKKLRNGDGGGVWRHLKGVEEQRWSWGGWRWSHPRFSWMGKLLEVPGTDPGKKKSGIGEKTAPNRAEMGLETSQGG